MTLTLRKPTPVGRVVVYAYQAATMQVEALTGGRYRTLATIQPRDDVPSEVRFAPVTTDAVRLTVLERRGDVCVVYEVEGYAE